MAMKYVLRTVRTRESDSRGARIARVTAKSGPTNKMNLPGSYSRKLEMSFSPFFNVCGARGGATWPGAIGLRHAAGDDYVPISPAPDARRSFHTNRLGKITRIGNFNFFNTLLLAGALSIPFRDIFIMFLNLLLSLTTALSLWSHSIC